MQLESVLIMAAAQSGQHPERIQLLVIAWPPIRPGGPWTLQIRGPRDRVVVRIISPPIAELDDPRAELLGEEFVETQLPPSLRDLMLPNAVIAEETLTALRPSDYARARADVEVIRAVLTAFRSSEASDSPPDDAAPTELADVASGGDSAPPGDSPNDAREVSFAMKRAMERAVRQRLRRRCR